MTCLPPYAQIVYEHEPKDYGSQYYRQVRGSLIEAYRRPFIDLVSRSNPFLAAVKRLTNPNKE